MIWVQPVTTGSETKADGLKRKGIQMATKWEIIEELIAENHGPIKIIKGLDTRCDIIDCHKFATHTVRIPMGSGHIYYQLMCSNHTKNVRNLKESKS